VTTDLVQHAFHGQPVRIATDEHGEPWFVLRDLCAVLGTRNVADVAARLDDDMKGIGSIDTLGGPQQMTTVTEAGMYEVIVRSDSESARPFRRWITTEVLPGIRRTGSYGAPSFDLTNLDDVALLVQAAMTALTRVRELEPPAAAWTAMVDASGDYSLRDAAQILDRDPAITTGQNRLGRYLRQIGWIDRRGVPYQRHVDLGRVTSRARTYRHPRTGEEMLGEPQLRLTLKGIGDLHKLLGGSEALRTERHLEAV
jgi:prophage antirepressor-like protein